MEDASRKSVKANDSVELLRCILEKEQCRPVQYGEAREVGDSLVTFYELLAGQPDGTL